MSRTGPVVVFPRAPVLPETTTERAARRAAQKRWDRARKKPGQDALPLPADAIGPDARLARWKEEVAQWLAGLDAEQRQRRKAAYKEHLRRSLESRKRCVRDAFQSWRAEHPAAYSRTKDRIAAFEMAVEQALTQFPPHPSPERLVAGDELVKPSRKYAKRWASWKSTNSELVAGGDDPQRDGPEQRTREAKRPRDEPFVLEGDLPHTPTKIPKTVASAHVPQPTGAAPLRVFSRRAGAADAGVAVASFCIPFGAHVPDVDTAANAATVSDLVPSDADKGQYAKLRDQLHQALRTNTDREANNRRNKRDELTNMALHGPLYSRDFYRNIMWAPTSQKEVEEAQYFMEFLEHGKRDRPGSVETWQICAALCDPAPLRAQAFGQGRCLRAFLWVDSSPDAAPVTAYRPDLKLLATIHYSFIGNSGSSEEFGAQGAQKAAANTIVLIDVLANSPGVEVELARQIAWRAAASADAMACWQRMYGIAAEAFVLRVPTVHAALHADWKPMGRTKSSIETVPWALANEALQLVRRDPTKPNKALHGKASGVLSETKIQELARFFGLRQEWAARAPTNPNFLLPPDAQRVRVQDSATEGAALALAARPWTRIDSVIFCDEPGGTLCQAEQTGARLLSS